MSAELKYKNIRDFLGFKLASESFIVGSFLSLFTLENVGVKILILVILSFPIFDIFAYSLTYLIDFTTDFENKKYFLQHLFLHQLFFIFC